MYGAGDFGCVTVLSPERESGFSIWETSAVKALFSDITSLRFARPFIFVAGRGGGFGGTGSGGSGTGPGGTCLGPGGGTGRAGAAG